MSYLLFALSVTMNAVMDTLKDHYYESVFCGLNKYFWNPTSSWQEKYKWKPIWFWSTIGVVLTDGWHLAKALMLLFIIGSILFHSQFEWLDVAVYPVLYFSIFELFYSRVLRCKH